ncbi:Fe2+-dependent dioxygenase [Dyella sp.]|jgi:PKHD-type hydroxylase|uniref:Fe2+-dependent dioxygenase n=1 Tax=Dyella sp. TaxID=1869338 RepID=UPI002D77DB80|nr:Fe2+-dependent dioxygenase [Dyella sp.]HET6433722.1 Fe2+-dependent dioxygenase [Dyella sp.]
MLLHVAGVLDAEEIRHCVEQLREGNWTDGRETVGAQGARVKRNLQLPEGAPVRQALGALVLAAVARHPLFHAAALPQRTLPPRFNRYEGGGHYGFHVDGAVMALPDQAGQLRSDIACTLFLSAPDEYDGGALLISDTYGEHEVKLPAGDLILYPASSLHRVDPVTRGSRLAAFFWVQSLVRDDGRRRTLFELDQAIQTLQAAGADAGAVLRLTNVYHNLLRQWVDT